MGMVPKYSRIFWNRFRFILVPKYSTTPVSWRPTTVNDDSFHSPTVIPPSALDKPSIIKCYHGRRTCSHTSPRRSQTMVTLLDIRLSSADGGMTVGLWKLPSLDGRRPPWYRPQNMKDREIKIHRPCNFQWLCSSNSTNSESWQRWRGRNSSVGSVLGSMSCLTQRRGFDPPLRRIFQVEGIFPSELTWVPIPFIPPPPPSPPPPKKKKKKKNQPNFFGWEYKSRSSLCTRAFHLTDSKDPDMQVLSGWKPAKTHPACTIHEDGMWLPQWLV